MGLFHSKPDENHIVELPTEMIDKILSYIPKKELMKISLVKKQWMAIINSKIENILIRQPNQENLSQVRNLINRFPEMKNLELNVKAMEVNDCLDFLPLTSLALNEVAVTFNIHECAPALWSPLEGLLAGLRNHGDANPLTHISKFKINLEDFNFKCHPSQVLTFEIDESNDLEKLKEDIMSFNNVTKIEYTEDYDSGDYEQDNLWSASIIECILTREQLKEIELSVFLNSHFNYENVFPKNLTVDEISFWPRCGDLSSKIWSKVFDALPNIKHVRVVTDRNAAGILRNIIRAFKGLKSLHFAQIVHPLKKSKQQFESQKIQDCCNFIKENFPLKCKVIIATYDSEVYNGNGEDVLTNRIVKEEGKAPKIVPRGSPGSIITWTDHDYEKFKQS